MDLLSGDVALTPGNVAYVPQQAWVTNTTLRENITFGSSFEQDRYNSVLEACALTEDFKTFPAEDLTEVGERGANLSGGQRQRVSLARAVYNQADLVLLDAPLSAVDAHVAGHIFQHCVLGHLKASGRTVVLVSHHLKYLKECDEIIVMKDGAVAEQGSHEQLMSNGREYANLVSHFTDENNESENRKAEAAAFKPFHAKQANRGNSKPRFNPANFRPSAGNDKVFMGGKRPVLPDKLMKEERMGRGGLQMSSITQYIGYMGGACAGLLLLLSFCLPVAAVTLVSWFLSYWLEQGGGVSRLHGMESISADTPNISLTLFLLTSRIPILFCLELTSMYCGSFDPCC
ncbi:multidrug resistance-associated protein 5 [Plakobranchus ocellatus]|uniref:Multidrug resistance-associated protein 5 n=1 Tax=Plakobranchus ocellatus TaxID=259542 RepID=A0AAV4A4J8_9GAST|nr:multidrug resistance-associated protein 5 [Plakobranchus ocellatus]